MQLKNILILFFIMLFGKICYCQEYNCNAKVGEFGMWSTIDATININSKQINVKPIDGVNISIEIDKYENGFYYFKNVIRVSIFSSEQSVYLITALGQTYKCKLKT